MEQFNKKDVFDVVEVAGHPYLFSNWRIDRTTIPQTMVAYDVRHDDECQGMFAEIRKHVIVNHWGVIIGFHELPDSYICNDDDGCFTGECLTAEEFTRKYGGNYGIH